MKTNESGGQAQKRGTMSTNKIILAIIPVVGIIITALITNWPNFRRGTEPPVGVRPIEVKTEVQNARVTGIGPVAPDLCTSDRPCSGLKRGSSLTIKLTRSGYALAFLQDQTGTIFNQEGRHIVANVMEGSSSLWPGTDRNISHRVFKLWVVASASKMTASPDSYPLEELPVGTSGQTWGPVYLKMGPQ